MVLVLVILMPLLTSIYFPRHRLVFAQSCITNQTDVGAIYLQQLLQVINEHNCKLADAVSYPDYIPSDGEVVDFIIIGAGSAGAVLANRLSENPNYKILLLEAGGDPTLTSEIPGLFPTTLNTDLDWQYRTQPEETNCLGMKNKSCTWPRGKLLGGSSGINAMLYVRGNPKDYDWWQNSGNYGWAYKHVLPYFKKSEDMRAPEVLLNTNVYKYHGLNGYLKVEDFGNNVEAIREIFSNGFKEMGLESYDDVNGKFHKGFFRLQGTLENARRCSTALGFLHPIVFQRENIKISKKSLAIKILMKDKTANGVQFVKSGKRMTVKARKEVIVSAGSINSPQLLMLSGLGSRQHLEEMGIKPVENLKVGQNLQDHMLMRGMVFSMTDLPTPTTSPTEDIFQFLVNSKGNLAGVDLFSNCAFFNTKSVSPSFPNIQVYFSSFPLNSTATLKFALETLGINEVTQKSMIDINSKQSILLVMPSLLRPRSVGEILLRSKNPYDHPLIYPGYFSNDTDVEDVLEAIRFMTTFSQTESMKLLDLKLEQINIPGCESFQFQSDEYWRCVIKHMSTTVFHPVGTCKMGPRGDSSAVVDPSLRVQGIKRLRVVDGSIIPKIPSGNTNAPIIMIAEKASDLIKKTWNGID